MNFINELLAGLLDLNFCFNYWYRKLISICFYHGFIKRTNYQTQFETDVLIDPGRPLRHRVKRPQESDAFFNDGARVRRRQRDASAAAFPDLLKEPLITVVGTVNPLKIKIR